MSPILIASFFALILTLALTALVLWIAYRLMVSAVRQGVLEANAEQASRDAGNPPTRWSILAARPEDSRPSTL